MYFGSVAPINSVNNAKRKKKKKKNKHKIPRNKIDVEDHKFQGQMEEYDIEVNDANDNEMVVLKVEEIKYQNKKRERKMQLDHKAIELADSYIYVDEMET